MKHVHEFSAIWSHFGPHGPQNVHYHLCIASSCDAIVLAPERTCDGDRLTHNQTTLTRVMRRAGAA